MNFDTMFKLSYDEYVDSLLKKYGSATSDYFTDETYKEYGNYSRTMEGLICHHIDEDKEVLLSDSDYILNTSHAPFDYQKAERLVYCDFFEHLLLHMKIMEKELTKPSNKRNDIEAVGIGGFTNIVFDITEVFYFQRYEFPKDYPAWKKRCAKKIKGLEQNFAFAIKYFVDEIESRNDFNEWYESMVPLDEMLDYTHKVYAANFGEDNIVNKLFKDIL